MADRDAKTAGRPLRIYEYINADGVIFWSVTRLDGLQTHRMVLTDVRGTYFRKHISEIHQLAMRGAPSKDSR